MWNNNRGSYNLGCLWTIALAAFSLFGFLIFPEAGFFAPVCMFLTIFGGLFLTQMFWRTYYNYEPGMHRLDDKKWVHIQENRISIDDGIVIPYAEITRYNSSYYSVTIDYVSNVQKNYKILRFSDRLQNIDSFYKEFNNAYDKFIKTNNQV